MIYRKVGRIKEEISLMGLGCWNFGGNWDNTSDENSVNIVHKAIDLGVNFFDVAPIYGNGVSETVLGKAIKGKRDKVLIASKAGLIWDENGAVTNNLSKKSMLKEIDDSLMRLGVDYIDLYQMHWPDPATSLEETADALNEIKKSGKIRYIGLTNFSANDIKKLMTLTEIDSQQGLYNMLERNPKTYHAITLDYRTESEIFPIVRENGQAFFPYSPFFQGLLTGEFQNGAKFSKDDVRSENPKLCPPLLDTYLKPARELYALATENGLKMMDLTMNWLKAQPEITSIICGVMNPEQMEENVKSMDFAVSEEIMAKVSEIIAPFEML